MKAFIPPRWLRSPHVQTVMGTMPVYAPPRSHRTRHEEDVRIAIDAGPGRLHARAWWQSERAPAVVILHGIAGSKDSLCCVRSAVALYREGYHTVRLDMRGAGESVVDAPTLYHAGLSSDLGLAVDQILQDARVSEVFVLGFSGGGSVALKLAGEWGANVPARVAGVASISAPLDYRQVGRRMDSLPTFVYRRHVLGGLLDRARAFAQHHPERASHYTVEALAKIRRFREFDGSIIVPMHGFSDVDDYYWAASSGQYLPRIHVPTMLIHAEDDPMVPISGVTPWLAEASAHVHVRTSPHGGHLGWLGGFDENSWINSWAVRAARQFFDDERSDREKKDP